MTTNTHSLISKFIRTSLLWRGPRIFATVLAFLTCCIFSAKPVWAHGFALRYDLPLPLNLYLVGSGFVVFISFIIMARTRQFGRSINFYRIPLSRFIPDKIFSYAIQILFRYTSVLLLFLIIFSGLFGNQNPLKNIAPVTVWVVWWVGFVYVTALVGNTWPIVNPWSSIYQGAQKIFGIRCKKQQYPSRFGVWPALILFIIFAWIELVWAGAEQPRRLAIIILAYSGICWIGMSIYGHRTWLQHGEVFSIIFGIFGRFSPIEIQSQEGPHLRPYGIGLLSQRPASISLTVFVLTLLATVTFDGFMETPAWLQIKNTVLSTESLRPPLLMVRSTFGNLDTVFETIGLISAPVTFIIMYFLTCSAVSWLDSRVGNPHGTAITTVMAARWFVLSVVPIAIAYHLAHYLSYFLIAGQLFIPLLSDPLGIGWNIFDTADRRVNIGIINAKTVWHISIFVIVLGHVIAVYLAHATALQVLKERRRALISQLPMTALMIGYTSFSLWILAQPIVTN